jgi:hypothetical protein
MEFTWRDRGRPLTVLAPAEIRTEHLQNASRALPLHQPAHLYELMVRRILSDFFRRLMYTIHVYFLSILST